MLPNNEMLHTGSPNSAKWWFNLTKLWASSMAFSEWKDLFTPRMPRALSPVRFPFSIQLFFLEKKGAVQPKGLFLFLWWRAPHLCSCSVPALMEILIKAAPSSFYHHHPPGENAIQALSSKYGIKMAQMMAYSPTKESSPHIFNYLRILSLSHDFWVSITSLSAFYI